jgi:uncharacterized membrane protein
MTPAAITQTAQPGAKPAAPSYSIRTMQLSDIWEVLKLGFQDVQACRTDALTIAVIAPMAGIFLGSVVVVRAFLPFVFPICAGFALLGPMATLWFAALSRRRERGDASALSAFTPDRLVAIQRLCAIAIMLFITWNVTAGIIYGVTMGSSNEDVAAPFFSRVFHTQAGWSLIIAGCSTGAIFAVLSLAVFLISFPVVLDKPVTAFQAIGVSVQAMVHNPFFVLAWGAVVVAGLLGGALPAMLGIVITLPVLGHGSWHLYRRMVVWA